jgi:hypothetical protein
MDPTNKPKAVSPNYSLYQRDVFKRGGEKGQREFASQLIIYVDEVIHDLMIYSAVVLCSSGRTGRIHEEETE